MKQIFSWLTDFQKKCPVCDGTGKIECNCNENRERFCPNCHGNGVVSVRKTISQTYEVPCDFPGCNKGKIACGICNGTGKNLDGSPCKACHGSGRTTCHVCGGIGKIKRVKQESWLEHETCHICHGRGMVACYQCHGTKERVCPECKGIGTVLNKRKIALLVLLGLVVVAMPVLVVVIALLALGYCLFMLEQKHKETQVSSKEDCARTAQSYDDAHIEYEEID